MDASFHETISKHVSNCLQLAVLLEVSAYPKPGNVHRTYDFKGTKYEHFLASSVALAPHFEYAAKRGILISHGKKRLNNVGIGRIIKESALSIIRWQRNGNTLLGSAILLLPLAVAAGITLSKKPGFSLSCLRQNLKLIVESTTPVDAVAVYDAILVSKVGGLGKAQKLDLMDPASKTRILEDQITLFEVFEIAAEYDSIASEWVNNYSVIFDIGNPYFVAELKRIDNINVVTVNTFLKILSEVPDTLIARKAGLAKAKEVSILAKQTLQLGGLATPQGKSGLLKLERTLRDPIHKLNPGTTADLTAAVLAINILNGYRP
jgi:triphosphoribosyl-dephospho-CoA synthase